MGGPKLRTDIGGRGWVRKTGYLNMARKFKLIRHIFNNIHFSDSLSLFEIRPVNIHPDPKLSLQYTFQARSLHPSNNKL